MVVFVLLGVSHLTRVHLVIDDVIKGWSLRTDSRALWELFKVTPETQQPSLFSSVELKMLGCHSEYKPRPVKHTHAHTHTLRVTFDLS